MARPELRLAMDPEDIDIELRDVDTEIIRMLEDGRCTRRHLAESLGYTGEYVYQRVRRLMEHGIVEKIHDGFYELATDGGHTVSDNMDATPIEGASTSRTERVELGDDVPQHIDRADARAAVRAALAVVDADGPVERKAIADAMFADNDLGYDSPARDGAWWKRVIKPGLKANGCEHVAGRGWLRTDD